MMVNSYFEFEFEQWQLKSKLGFSRNNAKKDFQLAIKLTVNFHFRFLTFHKICFSFHFIRWKLRREGETTQNKVYPWPDRLIDSFKFFTVQCSVLYSAAVPVPLPINWISALVIGLDVKRLLRVDKWKITSRWIDHPPPRPQKEFRRPLQSLFQHLQLLINQVHLHHRFWIKS